MLLFVNNKGNSKELIVQILSEEWPLNLKKIHSKMKKQGKNVSYQAIHKTLKEMVANYVIKKDGREYQINMEWVCSVKKICSIINNRYASKGELITDSYKFENFYVKRAY